MVNSEMHLLGNIYFGTSFPLRFRAEFHPKDKRRISRTKITQTLIVKSIRLYSQDRALIDPDEIRIAMSFIMYGNWEESEIFEHDSEGGITSVTYEFRPPGADGSSPDDGLDMVASLSSMILHMYRDRTTSNGRFLGVLADFEPGSMRDFVPGSYHTRPDRGLRLAVIHVLPRDAVSADHKLRRKLE
jgi:hypothetical protein